MIQTLFATAGLVLASAVLGQALAVLCGFRGWRPWAPAVGFALLLAIGAQVGRVPGRALTLVVLIAALLLASLLLPGVLRALRAAVPAGLPLAAGVLVVSGLPFYATGRAGVLGVNVSNDMSAHLVAAYWLRTRASFKPAGAINDDLIADGYPLGPHGLVATLAEATGMPETYAFSAFTLAVPVLAALAALTVLPKRPRFGRTVLAALAGLPYLAAAYLTQGAFKETVEGLVLLAAGVLLVDIVRDGHAGTLRRGVPLGALAAGGAYTYSYAGALWPLGAALLVLALELVRRWRRPVRYLRSAALAGTGALIAFAVTAGTDLGRMLRFNDSKFTELPSGRTANLFDPLPPLEAVGVWLVGDFRLVPDPAWPSYALASVGVVALVAGLPWWWRRAALGPPAALVSGIVLWTQIALDRNAYAAAKGLAVLAPVLMLCIGAPLLAAWGARARSRRGVAALRLVRVVGLVLSLGAAASSFAVLRDASVGLGPQERALERVRRIVGDQRVLFVGIDHFIQWELRGTALRTSGTFYSPQTLPIRPEKPAGDGEMFDVDNFAPGELDGLDGLDWIVMANGHASAMPPNFRLARRVGPFLLFRRSGPTPPRVPLERTGRAGAVLRCDTPQGASALERFRAAAVLPEPILFDQAVWRGRPYLPGGSAIARVQPPRGRWDVSLQYVSPTGLEVSGPGLRAQLPPWFGRINSFWRVGTMRTDGRPLELRARAGELPGFGRLLRAARRTRAITSPGGYPLNKIAFSRHGARPRIVPVAAACGRWVDFYLSRNGR